MMCGDKILAVLIDTLSETETPLVSAKFGVHFEMRPNRPVDRENGSVQIEDTNGV